MSRYVQQELSTASIVKGQASYLACSKVYFVPYLRYITHLDE
jgi:hypothetical protein